KQVDELAERARVHDQRVARLAGVVALGPPEHVAIEVEQPCAALVVEQRGIHRDRDMVEGGSAHDATSGLTITLPASLPSARSCIAVCTPSSVTSTGSISASIGNRPEASKSSAGPKPAAS